MRNQSGASQPYGKKDIIENERKNGNEEKNAGLSSAFFYGIKVKIFENKIRRTDNTVCKKME